MDKSALSLEGEYTKQTNIEMEANLNWLPLFYQQLPLGIIQLDLDRRVVAWNDASEKLFGFSFDEVQGLSIDELIIPNTFKVQFDQLWKELLKNRAGSTHILVCDDKNGQRIESEWTLTPLMDDEGSFQGITSLVRKISEPQKDGETSQLSEERYRLLIENASEAIWEEDFSEVKIAIDELKKIGVKDFREYFDNHPDFVIQNSQKIRVIDVNPHCVKMFGAASKEELLTSLVKIFVPETLDIVKDEFIAIAEGKRYLQGETINRTMQGKLLNVLLSMSLPEADAPYDNVLIILVDITERKRGQLAISEQRAFLQQIIDSDPNLIFVKDRESRFVLVNRALAEIYGFTPEGLIGRSDADFNPDDTEVEQIHLGDLKIIDGQLERFIPEEPVTTPDGNTRWLQTIKRPLIDDDGISRRLLGVATDITERKKLENQIQESLERRGYQVQVSTQVAQDIAGATDLNELIDRVVVSVKERFGYYHTQLLRYDPTVDAIVLVKGYGEIGAKMLELGHSMKMGVGLIGTAAETGETVLRPILENDPDWRPNPMLPRTRGEIAVPIKLRDQVLGVLDVQSDKAGALNEEDKMLLEGLCGQIAVAFENTRLRQEMEARLNELDMMYKTTTRVGWENYLETTQTSLGYIYDNLVIQSVNGLLFPELSALEGKKILNTTIKNQENKDEMLATVSPIAVRGVIIGAMGVYDDPIKPLSEDELVLIEQVSDQVAEALENSRLYQQTQSALTNLQKLYRGSAQVSSASTIQEVFTTLIESTPLSQFDHSTLYFFDHLWEDEPPASLVVASEWYKVQGDRPESIGKVYALNQLQMSGYFNRNEPLIIQNINTEIGYAKIARNERSETDAVGYVHFPIRAGGQWFGVLVGESSQEVGITENDIPQIANLVGQASTVIQSLRLKQEMSDRLQELTTLQRLMSQEAWSSYQTQATAEKGYYFDQINIHPEIQLPSVKEGFETHLSVRGESIGILGVKQEGGQKISEDEEAFLNAISEQVAQALERARLLEQTKKSAIELQAVAEVGTATATILEPEKLLKEVVDLTNERFGLYQALIFLLDDLGANLKISAGAGQIGESLVSNGWIIPIDREDSLVSRVARAQEGQFLSDLNDLEGSILHSLLPDTRSELAVPLIIAGELLGVFDVHSETVDRFTEEDIRTFSTLAAQVTVALQNARLYAEQLAAVERLRELDNMKSAFLANMSHELRTPLNSILGFTQVILEGIDGPLTDAMVSDLELIEKNGVHLLDLINDVLDMAKIEAGRTNLNLDRVNLYELIGEVIETSDPLSREKGLSVKMVADSDQDWNITADLIRLRQVLINLVGNSIKFTDKGGVIIELEKYSASDESDFDKVKVCVRDTGIGIPLNKLEEIFQAFSQIDTSTTRKVGGTGLGLPISRRLVELHGGNLWAESEGEGKGSVFFLELPTEPKQKEIPSELPY